ncbi:MAG: hypothetical protein K2K94_05835 [Muribaculaceae bacterium]|nr:hypothetical protein [Muribaculaceae bacterium]
MKKTFTLSLALALCTSVYAEDIRTFSCGIGTPGFDEPSLVGLGISPNGKYICGTLEQGAGIFVASNETGDVNWLIVTGDEGGELRQVDNNGVAIGVTDEGILFSMDDAEESIIYAPSGYRYFLGNALTNDGSMMVGSLYSESFLGKAVYTYDGEEWSFLPTPTKEELGDLDPRADASSARFVSADGKVIVGHLGSFGVPIVWIKNEAGEYEADFFPARHLKDPLYAVSGAYYCMSNNGRYVCMVGKVREEGTDNYLDMPVVYDTEKREVILYNERQEFDLNGNGLYPCAISDDGTMVGTIGQPYWASYGSFIWKAGEEKAEKFSTAFPVYAEKLGAGEDLGFNMPVGISADGRYILGYTYYCDDYDDNDAMAYWLTYTIDTQAGSAGIEDSMVNESQATPAAYYSVDGKRLGEMSKGINIVRMSDGTVRKVIKK